MSKYRTEWSKYIAHTEECNCSVYAGNPTCNCGLVEWINSMELKCDYLKMEFGMVSQSSEKHE